MRGTCLEAQKSMQSKVVSNSWKLYYDDTDDTVVVVSLLIQLNPRAQNVFGPWREPQRRYKSKLRSTKHESPRRTIEAPCTPRSWGGGRTNVAFMPPRTIKILGEGRPRGPRRVHADAHIDMWRGNQSFRITRPDYWRSETQTITCCRRKEFLIFEGMEKFYYGHSAKSAQNTHLTAEPILKQCAAYVSRPPIASKPGSSPPVLYGLDNITSQPLSDATCPRTTSDDSYFCFVMLRRKRQDKVFTLL